MRSMQELRYVSHARPLTVTSGTSFKKKLKKKFQESNDKYITILSCSVLKARYTSSKGLHPSTGSDGQVEGGLLIGRHRSKLVMIGPKNSNNQSKSSSEWT